MVDILLATYNGEKFLKDLLSSLKKQNYVNWNLIVIDDCSTDETLNILYDFSKKVKNNVEIHINKIPKKSGKINFFELLKYSKNKYFMFCDQDDVWLPNKIDLSINYMREMEKKYGEKKPLLVHSDLCVADEKLNIINNSFFNYSKLLKNGDIKHLLCQNNITGCTICGNSVLKEYMKIPNDLNYITMHDSWAGLISMTFGFVSFIDKSTILYRQHQNNSVGAKNTHSIIYKLKKLQNTSEIRASNMAHIIEADYFLKCYGEELFVKNKELYNLFCVYSNCKNRGKFYYRLVCIKNSILKVGIERKITQLLCCHK